MTDMSASTRAGMLGSAGGVCFGVRIGNLFGKTVSGKRRRKGFGSRLLGLVAGCYVMGPYTKRIALPSRRAALWRRACCLVMCSLPCLGTVPDAR